MATLSIADTLGRNRWFQALEPEQFQMLVAIASEFSWKKGQIIFGEGDQDDRLYLILEGRIALEKSVPGKGRTTFLTLGPNEIFGWSAVTPVVRTRTASARAVRQTRAIAFDSKALREACKQDHDLGYVVYRRLTNVISGRLSATRLQLIDMYASNQE
jgi:CRP-like cAMP-binding protein